MRTRSSSNLPVVSPPNPSTLNLKRCNRRRSRKPFILEESPVDTMAYQRTMAELLRAPTEGYAEAIVVPPILVEQFELKHSLINVMTSDQFFGLEKDNLHDHIWAARRWLEKELPCSILTLEDLAWDRYKDLLRACPHHGFTELHQLDTFYNALNPIDQDSLNSAAGGNLLERRTQDVLTIIKNKSKFQATPPPAFIKSIEEICVTCGGAHPYYRCLAADGNTFPKVRDNIQGYVAAAAVNYNQGNSVYRPPAITTRSGIILDGPSVLIPPPFINPEEDERVEETLTDQDLAEYTIKVPPPLKMLKALLSNKEKLQELANTPLMKIAQRLSSRSYLKNLETLGNFSLSDFVIVDYESDPRVPHILGIPFLRTARALIEVHGEEMILHDGDERLTLNMIHDTSSYSNQPQKESINLINVFNDSNEDFLEDLFSTNQPSGNPTFSSRPVLTSSEVIDDIFDPKGGNILPEKLLDLYSTKDLHPPSCQFIKWQHHLFFFSKPIARGYDSILSEDFSKIDALSSTNNEDKVFNLGILTQENLFEIITRVSQDKKLAISHASLMIENFDPLLYELSFFKEVPSDNESFFDEDISKEIYSNPLFDEEIISMKIDPHHFNAESNLIESLLNHDSSIISSSSKIDSLLDEFAGELILLKLIPPGIDGTNCDPEEEIRLIEKLLYDNSSPQIDLTLTSDDSMPPGIEKDDYDSERDILILEEFHSNDSLSLSKNKSFHFDIPSSPRPPTKPPDDDSGILTVKTVGDISEHDVPMPRLLPTNPPLLQTRRNLLIFYLIGALKLFSFLLNAR
uniref:Reverse transcriptase domain-containing protein n=1 Tax=Tanacetum cinerariifolium TaxID=118510 RepID=A0A6L2MVU8_TANCI|nr:reverse transcriptase domain-containing protein [Tanacetum cinerariifolium]